MYAEVVFGDFVVEVVDAEFGALSGDHVNNGLVGTVSDAGDTRLGRPAVTTGISHVVRSGRAPAVISVVVVAVMDPVAVALVSLACSFLLQTWRGWNAYESTFTRSSLRFCSAQRPRSAFRHVLSRARVRRRVAGARRRRGVIGRASRRAGG